jgi:hypothetical protein
MTAWWAYTGAGVFAIAASACGVDEPVLDGEKAKILLLGDSIAANAFATLEAWTEATRRATLYASVFPGTALCDFLDGKPEIETPFLTKLPLAIEKFEPQLIIFQFWGNRGSPCTRDAKSDEEYLQQYFLDALLAAEQIEFAAQAANIPRPKLLWVLQGPEADSAWPERTRRLNEAYSYVAEIHGDRTSDAGFSVSQAAAHPAQALPGDRYAWAQYLPCTEQEKTIGLCTHPELSGGMTQLHRDDDPVHFCLGPEFLQFCGSPSPGAVRYGSRIAEDAARLLGW